MSEHPLDLLQVDREGAIQEAAHRVAGDPALEEADAAGDTRAAMLRKVALGGGAIMGGGLLLGLPTIALGADTRSSRQDIEILNFALTLEYLEAEFYALARQAAFGGATGDFANIAGQHEAEHVDFLKNALGLRAVPKPSFDFGAAVTDPAAFRSAAVTLEDAGVAAYVGQAFRLKRTAFILAVSSILAVEARHSAHARVLEPGRSPSEEAFSQRATMAQVLAVVEATGYITDLNRR
jgi:hypothetical protein